MKNKSLLYSKKPIIFQILKLNHNNLLSKYLHINKIIKFVIKILLIIIKDK